MSIASEEKVTITAGTWILTEGQPNYFYYYKLLKGTVSIYSHEFKISEIEVKEGDQPVVLGIIAALRKNREPIASVKTETEIEAIRIHIDQAQGILYNEIPRDIKSDVMSMIDSILLKNEIESLKKTIGNLPDVEMEIPDGLRQDVNEMLLEIKRLYDIQHD